ncbi:hypothetical protein [Methylosinus sp. KRF6]|nr:hypothetical protein [Methylosinus sp. KRF6]MBU3887912.1 hypothetical protein [Methylosinus sp. KRF6]
MLLCDVSAEPNRPGAPLDAQVSHNDSGRIVGLESAHRGIVTDGDAL